MTDLTRIANKFGTDKGTVAYEAHGYTEEYAKYIPNLGKYTLLEIGVWHCDSMRMWQDYNPDMNIVGVDIDPVIVELGKKYFTPLESDTVVIADAQKYMKTIAKVFKWAYGDSIRYIAFLLAMATFVGFLQVLIVYPVQTIATILIGFVGIVLFTLFTEWK